MKNITLVIAAVFVGLAVLPAPLPSAALIAIAAYLVAAHLFAPHPVLSMKPDDEAK